MDEYDGRQYVGIDLHRRRSVIVRLTPEGERLGGAVRIDNDPVALGLELAKAGPGPGRGAYQVRTWRAWYAHITTKATTT